MSADPELSADPVSVSVFVADVVEPTSGPLAGAVSALQAVERVMTDHPELPEVTSWTYADGEVHGSPYVLAAPVSALVAWMTVLPTPVSVTAHPAAGGGTELTAHHDLGRHVLRLSVVTWREVQGGSGGAVTVEVLADVAAQEGYPVS